MFTETKTTQSGLPDPKERRCGLIVEDEGLTVVFLQRVLRSRGYAVVGTASNGAEGVNKARETQPDFILMDINMPVMDGSEAAKRIMAERPIPIILLTAYSKDSYLEEAKQAGVCGYLIKPLSLTELTPAIEEAFRCYDNFLKTGVSSFHPVGMA